MERINAQINWAKLVKENRAKADGVPWTESELEAIYKKGIDPELIRLGKWKPTLKLEEVKIDGPSDNLDGLTMVNLRSLYKERFKKSVYPSWKKVALIAALRAGEPIEVPFKKEDTEVSETSEKEDETPTESPVVEDSK